MSVGGYIVGALLLALTVIPLGAGATRVRHRLVPDWTGAPARLVDVTVTLALLLGVLHAVGMVGQFRRGTIVVASLAVAAVLLLVLRGSCAVSADGIRAEAPGAPRWMVFVAGGLGALVLVQWIAATLGAFDGGVLDYDSLTYHLPQAGRFVETGWITGLHFAKPEFPNMFHPADSELLHALGMAMFGGRDFLSPLLNMGWFGLAILAGWCVGRPTGTGPITMAGTLAVLAAPHMGLLQPGSALNDVSAVVLLLTAAALLLQPTGGRPRVGLAGAAAGIAIGIKFTVLAPVAVLTVAVLFIARRGERLVTFAYWSVPLALTGAFWFVRNLIETGNPVPIVDIGVLPYPRFQIMEDFGFTILHYVTDGDAWSDYFLPGLGDAMSRLWWLAAAVAAAGVVAMLLRGTGVQRAVGAAVAVGAASYIVNPLSAFGTDGAPALFVANIRYIVPVLALVLTVPFTLDAARGQRVRAAGLAVMAVLVVAGFTAGGGRVGEIAVGHRRAATAIALAVVAVLAAAWLAYRRLPRATFVALVAAGTVAVAGAGFRVQDRYEARRYVDEPDLAWLAAADDARIGYVGFDHSYLLYGPTVSNYVQYVGRRGPHGEFHAITTCEAWREALRAGRYDYVVHRRLRSYPDRRPETWTGTDPAVRPVLSSPSGLVYRVVGTMDPQACPVN